MFIPKILFNPKFEKFGTGTSQKFYFWDGINFSNLGQGHPKNSIFGRDKFFKFGTRLKLCFLDREWKGN
jgi:hypothetical protein